MRLKTKLLTFALLTALFVCASAAFAQSDTVDQPATLLDALDVPVCAGDLSAADTMPEGADTRSVLVFSFEGMPSTDITALMHFDSSAAADKAAALNLTPLNAYLEGSAELPATPGLYGWMVLFYDADGFAVCRSTGYPAAAGSDQPLETVSLQGFIGQMVSGRQVGLSRTQSDDACTFDTPQFCDAIFMGDERSEVIDGTAGADLISGGAGDDTISGNDGNDVLDGGDGDDIIFGGDGDDVITGGSGGDDLHGGDGDDIIYGGDGDDVIHGDQGVDTVDGEAGADTVEQD